LSEPLVGGLDLDTCIVSPGKTVLLFRMNLGISPVSALMSPLLSRGALVGVLLLTAVGAERAAPPQHALVAQSASVKSFPIADTGVEEIPPRLTAHSRVTSSVPPQVVAMRAPRATTRPKPVPPAQPRIAAGTGQWGLINQDRVAAGLAPLQWSPCLANVATGQAARMAAQGYISHANGRTLDLGCHLGPQTGENIGFQGGGINDPGMNAWFMGDPPHRANILGPYHYVGVAWVVAPSGTAYLAVEFG